MVSMLGCRTPNPIPTNLPDLVEEEVALAFEKHSLVSFQELHADTPYSIWEQFFTQRGGGSFWQTLQQREGSLNFDFANLIVPSVLINPSGWITEQEKNEVAAGIIHYLVCYQVSVKNMTLNPKITRIEVTRSNQLSFIPAEIVNIVSLTSLDLSHNCIRELPDGMCNLTGLNLSWNQLRGLPTRIDNLDKLTFLDLSHNRITELPAEIGNLASLKMLNLGYNQLVELPADISNFTNLTSLDISHNRIIKLSDEIFNFISLTCLDISHNGIRELSDEIFYLNSLRVLNLEYNQLIELPAEIFSSTNLSYLNLCENKLKTLPASINSKFTKLLEDQVQDELGQRIEEEPAEDLLEEDQEELEDEVREDIANGKLGNNSWIASSELLPINKGILKYALRRHARQRFPHSLTTLCMNYIENTPTLQNREKHLPKEVRQAARENRLGKAYNWAEGNNIFFFETIGNIEIPFHLDYFISTYQDIKNILRDLKGKQLYQIP